MNILYMNTSINEYKYLYVNMNNIGAKGLNTTKNNEQYARRD
jgi:hypothetical protein